MISYTADLESEATLLNKPTKTKTSTKALVFGFAAAAFVLRQWGPDGQLTEVRYDEKEFFPVTEDDTGYTW